MKLSYYYPTYDAIPKDINIILFLQLKNIIIKILIVYLKILVMPKEVDQAEKEIIKKGGKYIDYRNNIYFEDKLIKQRNIIFKQYKN